jgi:hypothetical protein
MEHCRCVGALEVSQRRVKIRDIGATTVEICIYDLCAHGEGAIL